MTEPRDLTIVIVSYNVRDDLERCLASLHEPAPALSHDIIVVDNASSDDSVSLVRTRWSRVQVLALPENRGFAAANNAGIRATADPGSRWILLLNCDTIVPPGAIERLVARAEADSEIGIAGPRLIDAEGKPELSFGPMPGPINEARQKRLWMAYDRGERAAVEEVRRRTSTEHVPDWVTGACLLVRRADAVTAGLLDERYFMYLEDADFCAAVRARRRRVLFTPVATVTHLRGRSRARVSEQVEAHYRRSQLAFYRKHHPGVAWALWLYLALRNRLPR